MEGRHCYLPATGCNTTGKKLPMREYSHSSNGRCAISGGYVYRGAAIPALQGWYVFGDYCSGEVWAVARRARRAGDARSGSSGTGTGQVIRGFGQDDAGELYLCDLNGAVYRIVPPRPRAGAPAISRSSSRRRSTSPSVL